jgi:hypothetical protein
MTLSAASDGGSYNTIITRAPTVDCEFQSGGNQYAALGCNIFDNRAGGSVVRIYRHRFRRRRNCEVPIFPIPRHVPDIFYPRHVCGEETLATAAPLLSAIFRRRWMDRA